LPAGFRHTLRLDPNPERTFDRLKPSVRNKIRASDRSEVTVVRAEQEDDITRIFFDLHTKTRRRLGVPVQPRRYFSLLWRRIVEPGLGFLLVARASDHPVAAAVFLTWSGTVVYKYGASDATFWRLRPNNALLWHAINWACLNGYSTFDFGKTEPENTGLRDFKRGWGTEEASLAYAVLGPARIPASTAARAARLMGPIIRHGPPFVCRGLGRALYRYAA
jgi:lipid II:glycine glycyltransferase (peptidoglycan interpeptide bridge formation enzyme)